MWKVAIRLSRPKTGSLMWVFISMKTGSPNDDVITAAKRVMARRYPDWVVVSAGKRSEGV
jgi:hypothetical protein